MYQTKNKKFLVHQQGLQGAEFRSLGHMECIKLKKKIPGIPAGVAGCKIWVFRTDGMHQSGEKIVPISSEHLGQLTMSYHTLEKSSCKELPM